MKLNYIKKRWPQPPVGDLHCGQSQHLIWFSTSKLLRPIRTGQTYSPVSYCVHKHTRRSVSQQTASLCRAAGLQPQVVWTAGSTEPAGRMIITTCDTAQRICKQIYIYIYIYTNITYLYKNIDTSFVTYNSRRAGLTGRCRFGGLHWSEKAHIRFRIMTRH